ncbi:MAG: ankyrin repeat domain-containing protein [Candidatus Eremiobacteraeota bacterium]|nr:ankyrin repeat domain-containing protein [Candidatus Eremiobacteraeota bacterium]
MPQPLPERPSLDWLRKTAKQRLKRLREEAPSAHLTDAQFALAREYGFESWRALKSHVDEQNRHDAVVEPTAAERARDEVVGAFLLTVGTGRLDDVRAALAADPTLVNAVGPHPFWGGRPQALHIAIETKRPEMIDLLLRSAADVDGTNDEYDLWSPLMLSIDRQTPDVTRELLDRGARVGLPEALLLADDEAVDRLLRGMSALPEPAPNRGSFLSFARTPFAIDRLIELGAPTDTKDRWGSTPIDAMSRMGPKGTPLVRHMIARGISAQPEEFARLGDRRTLEALLDADLSLIESPALFMGAVDFGHHALVEWLIARGANVNARSDAGSYHTALHSAAWNGDLRMVQLLVEAGADVTATDEEHHNIPLGWAEVAVEVTNNPACAEVAEYLRTRHSTNSA